MKDSDLKKILDRIDHRGYPAYKDTKGKYDFGKYVLGIDQVQGDPFASPSKVSVHVKGHVAGFDRHLYDEKHRRIALQDLLLRRFYRVIGDFTFKVKGSGKSGLISVSHPGQEILERSAVQVDEKDGSITVRFRVGFPARGRTIVSGELIKILFDFMPGCVEKTLFAKSYKERELSETADLADDQFFIRKELRERGLKAFIADGSVLPRKSGISSRPMKGATAFKSPDSLAVTMELPHKGSLRGMGVPEGVTLIVGGGYHGKTTLLKALELGVYDHIKGDGREFVITDPTAVKLRAEDGRSVQNTDISMFIRNLPNGRDTKHFSTEDASGSTSQAACTVEAMEAGSKLLLIDEDTSATNFMIRDELMQRVVHRDEEPIIPFIGRVRELYEERGISTILVAGSSGSYFYEADVVIQMKQYEPFDITADARKKALEAGDRTHGEEVFDEKPDPRIVKVSSAFLRDNRVKTKTFGTDGFSVNKENVELRFVEQLTDQEQINALCTILVYMMKNVFDGRKSLTDCVEQMYEFLEKESFAAVRAAGDDSLAMPRKQEIYATVNRCRKMIAVTS